MYSSPEYQEHLDPMAKTRQQKIEQESERKHSNAILTWRAKRWKQSLEIFTRTLALERLASPTTCVHKDDCNAWLFAIPKATLLRCFRGEVPGERLLGLREEYDGLLICTGCKKLFYARAVTTKICTPLHEGPYKAANNPEAAQKAAKMKLAKKRSAAEALSARASAVVPDSLVVLEAQTSAPCSQACKACAKGTCAET